MINNYWLKLLSKVKKIIFTKKSFFKAPGIIADTWCIFLCLPCIDQRNPLAVQLIACLNFHPKDVWTILEVEVTGVELVYILANLLVFIH